MQHSEMVAVDAILLEQQSKSRNLAGLIFGFKDWKDKLACMNLSYDILTMASLRSWIRSLSA